MRTFLSITAVIVLAANLSSAQVSTNAFSNWETPTVHPVALSPDQTKLAVCNLADSRIELFEITSGAPFAVGSISVGLDPVSLRFKDNNELWVANFISDTISIVDVARLTVTKTIPTLNEPSDIVFAGTPLKAFVTCAQPNVIQVFNASSTAVITNLTIAGSRPRAMTTSADGATVYAAIFESGNASTIIGAGTTDLNSAPAPSPVDFPDSPSLGQNPPPNSGTNFVPAINPTLPTNTFPQRSSVIVKKNQNGKWMDDNNRDWSSYISGTNAIYTGRTVAWDIPDHDVAIVDASNLSVTYANGLMNICMDIAVNPASGNLTVVGTDAINETRFEPNLRGKFVRVEMATVNPTTRSHSVIDLNPHLDYATAQVTAAERTKSIGDPRAIVWNAVGTRGYVVGLGSDNLIIIDATGARVGNPIPLSLPEGPCGLALNEARGRLFILNRFAGSVSVVDTTTETLVQTVPLFDPTPTAIKTGRKHLYNTHKNSGLGQASCASCHLDARFDRLAWDLGTPAGDMTIITSNKFNFGRFPPAVTNSFHPMKGPMITQTLQDIINHEPFHWRGDREGLEQFNQTFTNLQAATSSLTTNELQEFKSFLATIRFAPNPFRKFDNSLSTNLVITGHTSLGRGASKSGTQLPNGTAVSGMNLFRLQSSSGCNHCHSLPTGIGPDLFWNGTQWKSIATGTNNEHHLALVALARSNLLPFKIPSLRNLYEKMGTDYTRTNSISGFGFSHDGSVDTLTRFIQDSFGFAGDQVTADMIAFLLSVTGSDLPAGSLTDPDRPPGAPSNDTPAAVGQQITITNGNSVALIDSMLTLASNSTSRIELIAKGTVSGLARGWFFDRATGRFLSDRQAETLSPANLRSLASPTNEITYTVVPAGCGRRLGIDRDADGYFDRDELDFGSDPANALSIATNTPPHLSGLTNFIILSGETVRFTATGSDNDIPAQTLTFTLGPNAPISAVINPTNGQFVWTPNAGQTSATNIITVILTDNGNPPRSVSNTFSVTVTAFAASTSFSSSNIVQLNWTTLPGRTFRVQYKTNLTDVIWTDVAGDITASTNTASKIDTLAPPSSERYYRILLLP